MKLDAVMVAAPKPKPVTNGCANGVVEPWRKTTFDRLTVTFDTSLLTKLTKRNVGAGCAKLTLKAVDSPTPTTTPEATMMSAVGLTVTFAVVFGRLAGALELAVIVVAPTDTPVTGTVALAAPAAKVTLAGTEAAPVLLEARLMVSPAGAGAERFSVRFCVDVPTTVRVDGVKLIVPFTCTS